MGDDQSEYNDCKPAHEVTLTSDFELAEYPVTQALWQVVMKQEFRENSLNSPERPVENVSWNDVQTFISVLNSLYSKSGNYTNIYGRFCLPTEAQWEYAARGGRYGNLFNYPFSGGYRLEEVGWYAENSHDETHQVGRKLPNILGLYDMSGNVSEWCEDLYRKYTPEKQTNPRGAGSGKGRVYRGGSWIGRDTPCRVAQRYKISPDYRNSVQGFRLAFTHHPW